MPSSRKTRHVSKSVFSRSSGKFLRWCKPPWTITISLDLVSKGSCLQSQTYKVAAHLYCASKEADRSTPASLVKPSWLSACNPLPRPQQSSTISAWRDQLATPNSVRRRENLRISSLGVSNRSYAVSQGSLLSGSD